MTAVLDVSATLALPRTEPGHELVAELLPVSVISAFNYCEVVQKLTRMGSTTAEADTAVLIALGAPAAPFDTTAAINTARLWPATRDAQLSLADRACLALAANIPNGEAVTADRAWTQLNLDVPVRLSR